MSTFTFLLYTTGSIICNEWVRSTTKARQYANQKRSLQLISFSRPAMHQSLGAHRRKILPKSKEWILPPYILHLAHTHTSGFTCTTCPCVLYDCLSGKLSPLPFELVHGWTPSSLQSYILWVPSYSNLDCPQHYHTLPKKNHSLYQPLVFPSWFILCVVKMYLQGIS